VRLEITEPRFGCLNGRFQSFTGGRSGKLQTRRTKREVCGCQIKIDHMYDVCDRMFASASNTTLSGPARALTRH
jgi:hypothetical protein